MVSLAKGIHNLELSNCDVGRKDFERDFSLDREDGFVNETENSNESQKKPCHLNSFDEVSDDLLFGAERVEKLGRTSEHVKAHDVPILLPLIRQKIDSQSFVINLCFFEKPDENFCDLANNRVKFDGKCLNLMTKEYLPNFDFKYSNYRR